MGWGDGLWDRKRFMIPVLVERDRRKGRAYLVYVCAYVWMSLYMCVYTHTHVYICIYIKSESTYVFVFIYKYELCWHVCICLSKHICLYISMCFVCAYICICMHSYLSVCLCVCLSHTLHIHNCIQSISDQSNEHTGTCYKLHPVQMIHWWTPGPGHINADYSLAALIRKGSLMLIQMLPGVRMTSGEAKSFLSLQVHTCALSIRTVRGSQWTHLFYSVHLTEPWEGRSSGRVVSCGRKGLECTLQEQWKL